ncbi:MAG: hypothetical protein K6C12_11070 [Oscillospiraceae bacterium]|nr:hypothetical protein [Oscillospiraceae bacterium]
MAKTKTAGLEAEFKHNTSIGEDGAILYDAPIQIRDQADLDNYHISWRECRTLNFHGSERVTVFFMQVESRSLAEYMWASLDTEHSRGYASVRCMIPGKRKPFIRCPDTVSCVTCPHKADRQAPVISLDGLVESGYELAAGASPEESAVAKSEYASIKAAMDAEDVRISKVFEMKEVLGFSVKEIAAELQISEPRIFQLIARAKAIGREYRKKTA